MAKVKAKSGDHPDYCDACHGVGGYCGMCNGAFWNHKEWMLCPDGTWHPAKKAAEQWQAEIDSFKRQIGVSDLTISQSRHLDWLIGRLLVAQGLAEFL